ncbi:hypothetical protein [Aquimarina sp. 2201CG5-10]|uniref:hypothetical protein n=1 Tax=Aquimarina callyspongiae TaxID=3098150 RepID=UPI002AB596A2|nr:hypothetical protein [Aquimarina sp. 2201CG5-10]MDY8137735.1 hypothetical protein [Aquimarina sp. 2201CG5-10]
MKKLSFLICCILLISCSDSDDTTDLNIQQESFTFEDDFEVQNNNLNELFPLDGSRWTLIQQVNPTGTTNEISIVNNPTSKGINSLRLLSNQSNEILSKIDIEKAGFKAFEGSTVTIKADFYVASNESIADLFLVDLECCSCWDPSVDMEQSSDGDNQCPGVRLKITGNGFLSIERGKISDVTIEQTNLSFPRNEWVTVEWKMQLSDQQQEGLNSLKINENEVISTVGMNFPNPEIFSDVFAQNGINFTLQEPVFYERIQVGATANPNAGIVELFVDNFSLKIE